MKQIIMLYDADGNARVWQTEFTGGDLKRAMADAALDYCKTEEGRMRFKQSAGFTYRDFLTHVPGQILEKYGLTKGECMVPVFVQNDENNLLDAAYGIFLDPGFHVPEQDVYKNAIKMGIMWGMVQTMEETRPYGTTLDADVLMAWAGELSSQAGETGIAAFFEEKLRHYKRNRSSDDGCK